MDMDALKPILAMWIRHILTTAGGGLVVDGYLQSTDVQSFVGAGMVIAGIAWSWWQKRGQADVAVLLKKLTDRSTLKAAKEVAKAAPAGAADVKTLMLFALLVLGALAYAPSAHAQVRRPQITGNIVADIKANAPGGTASAIPSKSSLLQLYQKLQTVSLIDLQYALNIAEKKNNKASAQCWQALIDQIQADQSANMDADGKPLPLPDPHLFTDVERLSDVINALGPNSPLMVGCGSFANQAKMNVLQMVTTIMAGGAGLAAFAP